MKEQRFKELFRKYLYERLTDVEEKELFQLWLDPQLDALRKHSVDRLFDKLSDDSDMPEEKAAIIFQQIMKSKTPVDGLSAKPSVPIWRRMAVASAVLLTVGLSAYFFLFNKSPHSREVAEITQPIDIGAPEINRATITLSDGKKIFLDSALSGALTTQGNVALVKLADGKIAYKAADASAITVQYNTLSNPRGSRVIDMTLTDGSRVWLNAGSSITYPVPFTGRERNVSIEGEAYFEIKHDAVKPFIVRNRQTTITVLGTHFNVNAYEDESDSKVTLLEGAVRVTSQQQEVKIKPGEQAIVKSGEIAVAGKVDLEQVMAWKDGYFRMKGTDIALLLRQIARWYDVEVVFENEVPKTRFGGSLNRELNLSDVLKALEQYGIHSRMNQGTIIIQ